MENEEPKSGMEKLINEIAKESVQFGIITERNRIMKGMKGLLEKDLPIGCWGAIKDIINPEKL